MSHLSKTLDMTTGRFLSGIDGQACGRSDPACGSREDERWFCLQTHQQAERWAEYNLKSQGYEVFFPLVTELRRDAVLRTMTRKVEVPCFPGYGFVRFSLDSLWRPIVSTRGVRRLFCTGSERPIPVPHGQVERMIADADARRVLSAELPPIGAGTQLVVTAGPFTDRDGVCIWSSETRTRLLMEVLGAQVTVEVARGAVRAK